MNPKNLFEIIRQGGLLMGPLVICSFVMLVFVFERAIALRRGRVIPAPFVKRFLLQLREGKLDRDQALELCKESQSPVAEVFAGAVRKWGRSSVEIEQAMIDSGERVAHGLRRYMRLFNAVATISPLLGLLGTVFGMIHLFNDIATSDAMGRTELLAGGISEALLTTAVGPVGRHSGACASICSSSAGSIGCWSIIDALGTGGRGGDLGRRLARRQSRAGEESLGRRLIARDRSQHAAVDASMPLKTSQLEEMPALNLTSLIDVLFLLIIFFMIGTKFIESERQIELEVPKVNAPGALTAAPDKRIINVYHDGVIMLDRQTVTLAELTARLAHARAEYPRLGVLVRGDGSMPLAIKWPTCWRRANSRASPRWPFPSARPVRRPAHARRLTRLLLLAAIFDAQMVRWIVWSGLVALTLALLVLMRTRWGQSHPLRKCIVLSLVAHLLLGIYTTTVNIVTGGRGTGLVPARCAWRSSPATATALTNADVASDADAEPAQSWELLGHEPGRRTDRARSRRPANQSAAEPGTTDAAEPGCRRGNAPAASMPDAIAAAPSRLSSGQGRATHVPPAPTAAPIEAPPRPHERAQADRARSRRRPRTPTPPEPNGEPMRRAPPAATDRAAARRWRRFRPRRSAAVNDRPRRPGRPRARRRPGCAPASRDRRTDASAVRPGSGDRHRDGSDRRHAAAGPAVQRRLATGDQPPHSLPQIYELRMAARPLAGGDGTWRHARNRGGRRGGAGLVGDKSQNADGRWKAAGWKPDAAPSIDGQDRRDAGTQADTGLTGLSLLAFLASGHTHLEGEHREQVRKGHRIS